MENIEVREKKSINKKHKIVNVILIIILILVCILMGVLASKNIKQQDIVKDELKLINNLDIFKDTIDTEIKANGNYGKIEKAIKEYYTDYFAKKKIFVNNRVEVLFNTLTTDYLKENKNKLKSLKLDEMVDAKTSELNEAIDGIIEMLNSDNIMEYVYKYDLSSYYNNFYRDNMVSKNDSAIQNEWQSLKNENSEKADYIKQIIKILVDNNDLWYVENDSLYFLDDKILNEYNELHSLIYNNNEKDNSNSNNNDSDLVL